MFGLPAQECGMAADLSNLTLNLPRKPCTSFLCADESSGILKSMLRQGAKGSQEQNQLGQGHKRSARGLAWVPRDQVGPILKRSHLQDKL